jgi:flagellar hook-associated protein 3 FlgL
MRIATNSYTSTMLDQFSSLQTQMDNLQSQVSTGLSIQSSSDNPTAMDETLTDLTQKAKQTQYTSNIDSLQTRANTIYSTLDSLQTIVSKASEIATTAASGTSNSTSMTNYADEVNSLLNEVVSAANTKDPTTGDYLFGGTESSTTPYTSTTDSSGNITSVTYNGNSSVNAARISDTQTVSIDIPGENTTGTGTRGLITDSTSGADMINHLISLRDDLESGDTTAISATDSPNLTKDEDNITYQVAHNGTLQNQLIAASTLASGNTTTLNTDITNSSSASLTAVATELTSAETAYQAALETSAKIQQLSILNYIS